VESEARGFAGEAESAEFLGRREGEGLGLGYSGGVLKAGGDRAGARVAFEGRAEAVEGGRRKQDTGGEQENQLAGGGPDADVAGAGAAEVVGHFDEADGREFGIDLRGAIAATGIDDDDFGRVGGTGGQEGGEGPAEGDDLVPGDDNDGDGGGGVGLGLFGRHRYG
jgi:hypothetical protein